MRVHARVVLLLSQKTYVLGVMALVEKRKWSVSLVTGPRYALLASMKYQDAFVGVDCWGLDSPSEALAAGAAAAIPSGGCGVL